MRNIFCLFCLVLIMGCDNELDLLEEPKEIPVVYALLDHAKSTQYIKVERAFGDADISGPELAKDPNEVYFDNISVVLSNKTTGQEAVLEKVDGNEEDLPREDGVFATNPNVLYKLPAGNLRMEPGDEIMLRIDGINEEKTYASDLVIIKPPFFSTPVEGSPLLIEQDRKLRFAWSPPNNSNIEVYSFIMTTNFLEIKGEEREEKSVKWIVKKNTDKIFVDEVFGRDYFSYLASEIDVDPDVRRVFQSITIDLISGDQNVADYLRVKNANLGITSSGEVPIYSNIENGVGIFGNIYTITKNNMQLSPTSLDELKEGSITKDLNFN